MKPSYLLMIFSLLLAAAPLQAEEFVEDEHYFEVFREHPATDSSRVQVEEFFWYACPHCFNLDPFIKGWLKNKPENVDFAMVPAMFERPNVIMHAKTFYALELMGVGQEVHDAIFHAIHEEHNRLDTQEEVEALIEAKGVDIEAYRKAMKSFGVNVKANQARDLAKDYEISGVPTLIVGGKYRTRSFDGPRMLELLDFLVDKVAREQAAKAEVPPVAEATN